MLLLKKGLFYFDRRIIQSNWKKMNEGPGKKAGNMVMRYARNSIRHKERLTASGKQSKVFQRASQPGRPPFSRAAGRPMKMIYSVTNMTGSQTIVGAIGFGNSNPVPGLHEHGGMARRNVWTWAGSKRIQKTMKGHQLRNAQGQFTGSRGPSYQATVLQSLRKRQTKMVKYPARPFMQPALDKVAPKLPMMWQGSLSRAA